MKFINIKHFQNKLNNNGFEYGLDVFFWLFVILIIYLRVLVFHRFNLYVIDSDQVHMWHGASDFSKGLFYEPRYYGQAYNTFMEALFAVPFLWMGLEVYAAVPLATHTIFLFPILFTAFYLYFNKRKWNAVFVLLIFVCLPVSYDFLTSLPRGFVTGLFFTSFFVVSVVHPSNLRFVFINTAFSLVAFFVNPNSVLVSLPFLFYLFLMNYKIKKYYVLTFLGLLIYFPLYLLFDRFYVIHPNYITHPMAYSMSINYFVNSFQDLDCRFGHVSFFIENTCFFLLLALFIFSLIFFKWNKKLFAAYVVFLLVILFSFISGKTNDGSNWIFFSKSRMYLGIPILLYLFISAKQVHLKKIWTFILVLPLLFFIWKFNAFNQSLAKNVDLTRWEAVSVFKLDETVNAINYYKKQCKNLNVSYIAISKDFWFNSFLNYGGPALFKDFPITQNLYTDRRYWVREANGNKVFSRFLLLAGKNYLEKNVNKHDAFNIKDIDGWGMHIVSNNTLNNNAFRVRLIQLENEKLE